MTEVVRYESLRNGKIATLVRKTDTEVVLDFDGVEKTIKMSNLKRWYKVCSIVDEQELAEAKESADKNAQLIKMVSKPDRPNGDELTPPKQDCSKLVAKIITYLEGKGCLTKKTCSYTRIRIPNSKRNVMEVWWGKRVKGVKIVVRCEAIMQDERLFNMGKTYSPIHFYVLDHYYKFDNSSNIEDIYKIIDIVIAYEKAHKPKEFTRLGSKNGTGRINGKNTLRSKREILGIETPGDVERKQKELQQKLNELDKQVPVAIEEN